MRNLSIRNLSMIKQEISSWEMNYNLQLEKSVPGKWVTICKWENNNLKCVSWEVKMCFSWESKILSWEWIPEMERKVVL